MRGVRPDELLLAVLADGPAHGYALIEEVRRRSGGAFDLPEGTAYPALHRLERAGLVTSRSVTVGGRARRVYRITRRGTTAATRSRAEWLRYAAAVDAVLGAGRES